MCASLGNNITGTGNDYGNILMSIGSGNALVGGSGNDFFIVTNGDEVVTEAVGGGFDTIWSQTANFTLAANVEQLVVLQAGGRGIANAAGGGIIAAASLNDILQSGAGDDMLWGNGQGVTYDFTSLAFGHDTLGNFTGHSTGSPTADVIDLSALHLSGMSALTFTDRISGGITSTTLTIAGDPNASILISGYSHSQMQASDFRFNSPA